MLYLEDYGLAHFSVNKKHVQFVEPVLAQARPGKISHQEAGAEAEAEVVATADGSLSSPLVIALRKFLSKDKENNVALQWNLHILGADSRRAQNEMEQDSRLGSVSGVEKTQVK